jgi:hypothetical protein
MKEENIVHHTYQVNAEQAYRMVIKKIHQSVSLDDI